MIVDEYAAISALSLPVLIKPRTDTLAFEKFVETRNSVMILPPLLITPLKDVIKYGGKGGFEIRYASFGLNFRQLATVRQFVKATIHVCNFWAGRSNRTRKISSSTNAKFRLSTCSQKTHPIV